MFYGRGVAFIIAETTRGRGLAVRSCRWCCERIKTKSGSLRRSTPLTHTGHALLVFQEMEGVSLQGLKLELEGNGPDVLQC